MERALKAARLAAPVPLRLLVRVVFKHHEPLLLRAEPHDVVELARARGRVRVRVRVRVRDRDRVRVRVRGRVLVRSTSVPATLSSTVSTE